MFGAQGPSVGRALYRILEPCGRVGFGDGNDGARFGFLSKFLDDIAGTECARWIEAEPDSCIDDVTLGHLILDGFSALVVVLAMC